MPHFWQPKPAMESCVLCQLASQPIYAICNFFFSSGDIFSDRIILGRLNGCRLKGVHLGAPVAGLIFHHKCHIFQSQKTNNKIKQIGSKVNFLKQPIAL